VPAANITVSVPLNSGLVGAIVSRTDLRLPVDISFQDFFSRVCARMDLDPLEAALGYKFHTDRAHDPPHQLSNEDELRNAMSRGKELIKNARTRTVSLEIHNLVRWL
jgi:hypothetical protein